MVNESILTSIKKLLGPGEEHTHFDVDIIIHINSALSVLTQMGVGPIKGYSIQDANNIWEEFTTDKIMLPLSKTYVYLKTRLIFDPPQTSFLLDAIKNQISEIEWRLNFQAEGGNV